MDMVGQAELAQSGRENKPEALQVQKHKRFKDKRINFTSKGKKYKYLAAFARSGRHNRACREAGVSDGAHYYWLKDDEDYAQDWEFARELATSKLESDIVYRGFEQEKPSDLLAIFHMKMLKPEYRDNYNINVKHTHELVEGDARAGLAALLERNPDLLPLMQRLVGKDEQHLLEQQPARIHVQNEAQGGGDPPGGG